MPVVAKFKQMKLKQTCWTTSRGQELNAKESRRCLLNKTSNLYGVQIHSATQASGEKKGNAPRRSTVRLVRLRPVLAARELGTKVAVPASKTSPHQLQNASPGSGNARTENAKHLLKSEEAVAG